MRQTKTPAFRRWFGDSVVVDEAGEPLVVYHGTDDANFTSFDQRATPRGGRKGRLLGEGFYFTSDPDQAAKWGRRVIAAYLRIENPRVQEEGRLIPATDDQDGTVATGAPGTKTGEVWFVVKSPRQIKSATDNDGSFDLDDPDFTSNGRETVTNTPAFRRWFGDSVVVDEAGEPLVVYHGTAADFSMFRADRGGTATDAGTLGAGFYFTTSLEAAQSYAEAAAEKTGGQPRVIYAYLKIKNPYVAPRRIWQLSSDPMGAKKHSASLKKQGFDGVFFHIDMSVLNAPSFDEFVVFDPRQIKSATDNDGSFDLDDPDFTSNGRTFIPPQKVADEAAYGLYLRSQMPPSSRCCTPVGLARAKQLSNRQPVSVDTLERMRSYFQRHEVDKRGRGWGIDSKGYQAWLLWGGDSGRAWANKMLREEGR